MKVIATIQIYHQDTVVKVVMRIHRMQHTMCAQKPLTHVFPSHMVVIVYGP
jgi:hypothetical protein